LIRKILSLIIIAFTIASCSTSKHVRKQDTSQLENKQNTSKHLIKQDKYKPVIKQDTSKRINKQDTSGDGQIQQSRQTRLKIKLEKEYKKYKGVPYKYGGTTYKGFDCSGFVQSTYKRALNVNLPRSTSQMLKVGIAVSKSKLKIGDLVFFKPRNNYRHVGIFMGDNMFIHVSSSRGVMKSSLKEAYWKKYYFLSRRVF